MRVTVQLIQKDLSTEETNVIADGPGLLNGRKLVYVEKETGLRHTVTFDDDQVVLERAGEFPSKTVLVENKPGVSTVDSPYGRMVMSTRLKMKSRTPDLWMVQYQVISGDEVVLEQQLLWKIGNLN